METRGVQVPPQATDPRTSAILGDLPPPHDFADDIDAIADEGPALKNAVPALHDVPIAPTLPPPSTSPLTAAEPARRPPLLGLAMRPGREQARHDWRPPVDSRGHRSLKNDQAPPALWESPAALLEQLDSLAWDCDSCVWAARVGDLLRELARIDDSDSQRAEPILVELRTLVDRTSATHGSSRLERARFALARRLALWELVATAPARVAGKYRFASGSRRMLARRVDAVAALLATSAAGETWRQFLLLDEFERVAGHPAAGDGEASRALARRVLSRLDQTPLDEAQRRFIARGDVAAFCLELGRLADEPVEPRQLLVDVERFEQTSLSSDAARLARHARAAAPWPGVDDAHEQIADWLESNYRNSNLRLAVSAALVNRLVPKPTPIEAPVRDRVLGVPTRGTSTTTVELGMRLIPDAQRLRFALEARGLVFANTTSKSGPATLYSHSDSSFSARKLFEVGRDGMHAWPTEADATNRAKLRDVRTEYDDVPLVGSLIERIARNRHAESEGTIRRIARQKVASRVEAEIDASVDPRVNAATGQFRSRLLDPLSRLALVPAVIEMKTDPHRVTVRLRLASAGQLAAFTPRPRAPGDSLASVQIHQSILNNIGERLRLDGRTFTLPELQQQVGVALGLPPETLNQEYAENLRIAFASEDSVRARFVDGRIELTLAIAELHRHPGHWRNFTVRVYYRPQFDGLDLQFVRDGTVQLRGERFGAQPQIALRGIFSKIFAQDRGLTLIDPKLARDPRLADLAITQCVVTDGWLGFALGAGRKAVANRQKADGSRQ
jgi:hypothetical protein